MKSQLKSIKFSECAAILLEQPEVEKWSKVKIMDDLCAPAAAVLIKQWNESNHEDYSIYTGSDYLKDLLVCYNVVSKRSIQGFIKYAKKFIPNYKDLAIYEDFNGCGLATADLVLNGFTNVVFHNPDKYQIQYTEKIFNLYGLQMPSNDLERKNGYDVVISLETSEHYKEPMPYVKNLLIKSIPADILFIVIASEQNQVH